MNKIFEFLDQNGTIVLITLLIFFFMRNKGTYENMKCDFDRPRFNYFFTKNKHIIEKYNLKENVNLVKSILNFNPNKNSFKQDNKKTISEFLKINEFKGDQSNFMSAIIELLNSNRIWNDEENYTVNANTKISEVRHIWLFDKLLTDLKCGIESKDLIKKVKKILDDKPLKMCDENELIKYCTLIGTKPKIGKLNTKKLEDEYNSLIKGEMDETKGKVLKKFKLVSLKENVTKFGEGYYEKELDKILSSLITQFENKFSRKYNKLDRNDLVKLVLLYVPTLQKKINVNLATSKNNANKKEIQLDLNRNRRLFYLLKHQYKLISIYNLINFHIKDEKKRESAYRCCSNSNSKGKCYDFDKGTKSTVQLFGFDRYGYVKDSKCTPESNKKAFDNQRKTFNLLLNEHPIFNSSGNNVKIQFYKNLRDLLNYFTDKKINIDIGKSSVANLLVLLKDIDIKTVLPEKLKTVTASKYAMNSNVKKILNSIQLANSAATILKLSNDNGLGRFNFLTFGEDMDKIKFAASKLIELQDLLIGHRANPGKVTETMLKMLALERTKNDYYKILLDGGILMRHHDRVMDQFYKFLNKIKSVNVSKISLSAIPYKTITYSGVVFPYVKDMDVCKIYSPILENLRKSRQINPNEFLDFKNSISQICYNRKSFVNKNKPLLYKDSKGRIREVMKKQIINNKGKKVTILVQKIKNNLEVVNISNNVIKKTGLIVKGNKILDKKDAGKSGKSVKISIIGEEGTTSKTSITIDKNIVKDESKKIQQESTTKDNLSNLVKNYF